MARNHSMLNELLDTCRKNDLNKCKAHLAFECYLELCEVRKLWSVDCKFNEQLKMFCLSARNECNGPFELYIPITMSDTLAPEDMEMMQDILSPDHKQINLMIKDRDSSTTYYRITQGLIRPNSPISMAMKKEEEANKKQIETEIYKNKKMLFAKALKIKSAEDNT